MDIIYKPLLQNNNWIILILVFMLSLLVVLKHFYSKQFSEQTKVLFKKIWIQNIKPTYANILSFYNFIFTLILSLCLAFVFYFFKKNFTLIETENDFNLYLVTSSILLLFFVLKLFLNILFSLFFNLDDFILKVIYVKISYLNFLSVVLIIWLPFVLFITKYQIILFYFGALITLILILYLLVLIIKINLKLVIKHFVYFILYLCALEIAPIILLYRVCISKN